MASIPGRKVTMDKPLWGLKVLKFDGAIAPRVLKFDSGYAAEGCCGRLIDKPLWGLRVDGPLGRRFLRGLSLTRLWREGCCRAPLNYRRRPFMIKPLQPPCGRGKCIPLWWLAPPPFPRSSVGRQKESALMGRLGALLRPTWRSYAGPPQWHNNPCLL